VTSFFKTKTQRLSLILCLAALSLLVVGCAGPTFQGWSGFAASDNVVYFGGIDGRVFAISPTARSQTLPFPSQDEWVFSVPSLGAPGSICGPACAPASPRASIYATPVVIGDLLCVGIYAGDSGKMVAINRLAPGYTEGVPLRSKGEWTYPSGVKSIGAIVGSPVVVNKTLYTGSSDGKLYAIDAVYGESKWKDPVDTGGKIWTSPVVSGGVIYVSNYAKKLYAIKDGNELWHKDYPAAIASSPVISGDSIYFGTFDHYLYAVNSTDGAEKWKFEGGNWFWSTPIVKDGTVYAGCLDDKVYAINASTGAELWQFVADAPIVSGPVLTNNLIVVVSDAGNIYVLDSENGNLVKSIRVGFPVMAPLFVEGNTVYVHAGSLCVYGIDLQSGEKVWEFCYSDIK
jgi:outer membrane protein assembly factor BamB